MEEAVILIANADEFRGDIISVSKKVFPRNNRAIAQDIKKSNPDAELILKAQEHAGGREGGKKGTRMRHERVAAREK